MDFREQWEKVDMDFFKQFLGLHNAICLRKKDEGEFDAFVLNHKEQFNNPDYLQVFAERIHLHPDYYEKHLDVCQFFYDFMENTPDWQKLAFGLRTFLRLGVFQDTFKEFIEQKENA